MFGIGLPEFILIMALALIVVGPEKLPDLAKTLAKQLLELKKTANALKNSLQEEMKETERVAEEGKVAALPEGEKAGQEKGEDAVIDVEARTVEEVYREAAGDGAAEAGEAAAGAAKKS
ncbi:MAG: twin-arginine translocase subunit TatB [Desulfurivibrio sp.]|jgi:sec-independent protein translocase protein TatB|nr:MAG: twin-arginine translocase subunit TatB [Desulfurivibrio sp.]